jgi:hypothetical protein
MRMRQIVAFMEPRKSLQSKLAMNKAMELDEWKI